MKLTNLEDQPYLNELASDLYIMAQSVSGADLNRRIGYRSVRLLWQMTLSRLSRLLASNPQLDPKSK